MGGASKFSIRRKTKSISLPCRSHPITLEIEEMLNRVRSTAAEASSADAICSGLSQLTRLYKCMDDLLISSTTKVLMSNEVNKKWVDEFIDVSARCLDICGSITHMLYEIKGNIRELLSSLRRRKVGLSFENSIVKYKCSRKKMKKDVSAMIGSLNQVDNMMVARSLVVDSDNHQLAGVIRVVIGVFEMTLLVFKSLLMLLCVHVSKPKRWLFVVSKLMRKGMVICEYLQENEIGNEFKRIDGALRILCKYGFLREMRNVEIAQCGLERLGAQMEIMEGELECILRFMVRSRVSLLNIISQ